MEHNSIHIQVKKLRPEEKAERNKLIYALYTDPLHKLSFAKIGKIPEINLTRQRVKKIFDQYCKKHGLAEGGI